MKRLILALFLGGGVASCSPLKSSPHDEKHKTELTLQEIHTSLDDLKHDAHCAQTEIQIIDGRLKYYEEALSTLKKECEKIKELSEFLRILEKKGSAYEKVQEKETAQLQQLATHAQETTASLTQFRTRIQELELELSAQKGKFDEVAKLKKVIEKAAGISEDKGAEKSYKVRPGDSLEKIARLHKTSVEKLKKLNQLADEDLIVVDQVLKLPSDG